MKRVSPGTRRSASSSQVMACPCTEPVSVFTPLRTRSPSTSETPCAFGRPREAHTPPHSQPARREHVAWPFRSGRCNASRMQRGPWACFVAHPDAPSLFPALCRHSQCGGAAGRAHRLGQPRARASSSPAGGAPVPRRTQRGHLSRPRFLLNLEDEDVPLRGSPSSCQATLSWMTQKMDVHSPVQWTDPLPICHVSVRSVTLNTTSDWC